MNRQRGIKKFQLLLYLRKCNTFCILELTASEAIDFVMYRIGLPGLRGEGGKKVCSWGATSGRGLLREKMWKREEFCKTLCILLKIHLQKFMHFGLINYASS
jgi:hypothetical protein